jgi:AcrR family transcriptional regulator
VSAQTADAELGPWERKRLRASLEIERVGLSLIADRGLDAVTVDQIAAAAGISTRTFFRYFRNVPDILTGVPLRETEHICDTLTGRPAGEHLLDSFHAIFEQRERDADPGDHVDLPLELEALALWGRIVVEKPEAVRTHSYVTTVLASGLEDVIRTRLGIDDDDDFTAGVLASALAGVIWFAYVRWLETGQQGSLPTSLKVASDKLAELYR